MPSRPVRQADIRDRPRIVIVDSEPVSARQTLATLSTAGYECRSFVDSESACASLEREGAEVMLADFGSAKTAADLLARIGTHSPQTAVVLMVANPAVPAALAAMRQGAFDYLTKPINTEDLTAVVRKAIEIASLRRENRLLHEQLDVASMAAAYIAESVESRNLAAIVRRAAPANSPVLIEGESGTGKELIARMLHHWSSRAHGPFVKLSFKMLIPREAAFVSSERNSPVSTSITNALSEFVERANGGTLFLDEISEATPEFQSALLQIIGDHGRRTVSREPAGGADVRIVASTNRSATREVAAGRIRPDLYFSLNVIAVRVAPLRERSADVLPLARHFLAQHAAETGRPLVLTPDAEKALLGYSWPGNVRELENVIERAVVMTSSERIPVEALMLPPATIALPNSAEDRGSHLATAIETASETVATTDAVDREKNAAAEADSVVLEEPSAEALVAMDGTLQEFLDRAAALRIKRAIDAAKGNRNAAATALGIDRTTLYRLMRRLGL